MLQDGDTVFSGQDLFFSLTYKYGDRALHSKHVFCLNQLHVQCIAISRLLLYLGFVCCDCESTHDFELGTLWSPVHWMSWRITNNFTSVKAVKRMELFSPRKADKV